MLEHVGFTLNMYAFPLGLGNRGIVICIDNSHFINSNNNRKECLYFVDIGGPCGQSASIVTEYALVDSQPIISLDNEVRYD